MPGNSIAYRRPSLSRANVKFAHKVNADGREWTLLHWSWTLRLLAETKDHQWFTRAAHCHPD